MTMIPPSIPPEPNHANRARRTGRSLGELLGIPKDSGDTATMTLPLQSVTVRASIAGDCAVTELSERYLNTSDRPLDVLHTIPLPASCAVIGFEIRSADRVIRGLCRANEEAEEEFESAKARGKSAALVTQHRDDVHRISLANIPPRAEVTVTLRMVERLRVADGRFEYRLPTAIGRKYVPGTPTGHDGAGWSPDTDRAPDASHVTPPVLVGKRLPLDLELRLAPGVTDIASSIALSRTDRADGLLVLRPTQAAACDGDVVVRFWNRAERTEMRAYSDGDRTLVVLDPPAARQPELERVREAVFVLDRSGSMDGTSLDAARRALIAALRGLKPSDRFHIIAFDSTIEFFRPGPLPASAEHVAEAIAWLAGINARGGTETVPALACACTPPVPAGHVRTVLMLTDGQLANDNEVLAITRSLDPACRLFVLGIGMAPSDALLSRLARMGGGTYAAIDGGQDIEREFARLESTLAGPIAFGLREAGSGEANPPTTDLFAAHGSTLFLDGHRDEVRITSLDGHFIAECKVERAPMPLGALWARQRVQQLEDRCVSHPAEHAAIDAEIRALGIAHQIQTRMTSFVAVDEQSQVVGEAIEITQPVPEPADRRDIVMCSYEPPRSRRMSRGPRMHSPGTCYSMALGRRASFASELGSEDSPVTWLATDGPLNLLHNACLLAHERRWDILADGLVQQERWKRLLSAGLPADADPAMAAAILIMLLACTPRRLPKPDMPEELRRHDLTPSGPLWNQCMAVLAPLSGARGWKGLISGATRQNVVAAAAGARVAMRVMGASA